MFIFAENASAITQLQLASPAIFTWRRLNPNQNGALPYRDDGVGLQLRGHVCGPDTVRSEMGFDVNVGILPPNPTWLLRKYPPEINAVHDQHGDAQCA